MSNIQINRKNINLHSTRGIVVSSNKNMETRVSGGGGGNNTNVRITSTTIVHDQLFLKDSDNKEHSFQLQGFNLAAREGNELTVVWGIRNGKKNGPYLYIYNHTTSSEFVNRRNIESLIGSSVPGYIFLIALVLGLYLIQTIGIVIIIVPVVYFFIKGKQNRELFISHIQKEIN
jgi:hypothetical protein